MLRKDGHGSVASPDSTASCGRTELMPVAPPEDVWDVRVSAGKGGQVADKWRSPGTLLPRAVGHWQPSASSQLRSAAAMVQGGKDA